MRPALYGIAVIAAAALSCGVEPAPATACAAIVGGAPDDAHEAVAALLDRDDRLVCSAVAVGVVDGRTAALTAAHCLGLGATRAAFGADYADPRVDAAIEGEIPHPDFNVATGDLDFGIVLLDRRVDVAAAAIADPAHDTLTPGSALWFVGFGATDSGPNTLRNQVGGHAVAVTSLRVEYDQAAGGPCVGDSGGPAFAGAREAGGGTIVAISSYGVGGGCRTRGVSGRASAAYPFLRSVGWAVGAACNEHP